MAGADRADNPFAFLTQAKPAEVANYLAGEEPLLAGTVLCRLPPALAAKVLANMTADHQREVVRSMRQARSVPHDVVSRLAVGLRNRLEGRAPPPESSGGPAAGQRQQSRPARRGLRSWRPRQVSATEAVNVPAKTKERRREAALPAGRVNRIDGMALAAAILRQSHPEVRRNIAENEPELFQALRKRMFLFEDLQRSPDRTLAHVFTAVAPEMGALALRFASTTLAERALAAVGSRRAEQIKYEMEEGGRSRARIRLREIEAAQAEVLQTALKLQQAGEVIIDPDDPDLL